MSVVHLVTAALAAAPPGAPERVSHVYEQRPGVRAGTRAPAAHSARRARLGIRVGAGDPLGATGRGRGNALRHPPSRGTGRASRLRHGLAPRHLGARGRARPLRPRHAGVGRHGDRHPAPSGREGPHHRHRPLHLDRARRAGAGARPQQDGRVVPPVHAGVGAGAEPLPHDREEARRPHTERPVDGRTPIPVRAPSASRLGRRQPHGRPGVPGSGARGTGGPRGDRAHLFRTAEHADARIPSPSAKSRSRSTSSRGRSIWGTCPKPFTTSMRAPEGQVRPVPVELLAGEELLARAPEKEGGGAQRRPGARPGCGSAPGRGCGARAPRAWRASSSARARRESPPGARGGRAGG